MGLFFRGGCLFAGEAPALQRRVVLSEASCGAGTTKARGFLWGEL